MPRLVSLTLLSVLVLPAAALAYVLVLVIGFELAGWRAEAFVWLTADLVAFGMVVLWWIILWARSIEWTSRVLTLTLLAIGGSLLLGMGAAFPAAWAIGEEAFGMFIGGGVAVVSWLVCACVIWRRAGGAGSNAGAASGDLVICPKCGYALNGLREARCPECGELYTIDALYRAQPESARGGDL